MRKGQCVGLAVCAISALRLCASAEVLEFEDKAAWEAAVGEYTTIDFTGFEPGTPITDQYADQGILFTDCDCYIKGESWYGYPNDGWGLKDWVGIHMEFARPQLWIATEFPVRNVFQLYFEGELIYESGWFSGGGPGAFGGLVSDQPFDEVTIYDLIGGVNIDDLHFGVPSPATPLLFLIGLYRAARRRV
jgi:hypothetical protein